MNDEYSEAFKSIVPDAPSVDGWADGAHKKRRNRRRAAAGVAGAAVLALAVPFALTLQGQSTLIATPDESGAASPAPPSPDPAADAPGAAACWESPGQPRRATAEGATDGAVRAWLCGDADVSGIPLGAVGPEEPLVDGVDEVVDFIQSQQTLDESGITVCTEEYILEYRIVLDYGDGTSRVVPAEMHGCRSIDDGPTVRTGGQELYDLAVDLWRVQRAKVMAPSGGPVDRVCPPPSRAVVPNLPPPLRPMLPLAPEQAVTGFACVEKGEGENWSRYSTTLDPEFVSLIAGSVATDSVEGLGESHLPTLVTIAGPWGEALTLQRTPRDTFQWFEAGTPMLWKPPTDVFEQIDATVQPPPESMPDPSDVAPPTPFESEVCEGVRSGEIPSSKLPNGVLPDNPAEIWLCGAIESGMPPVVGPLEPLLSSELTAEAVNFYNELGSVNSYPSCLNDYSPTYNVVHEYADGTLHVLAARTSDCDVISAGVHTKRGGREYVDELEKLWREQRAAQPSAQTRPGPLCPLLSSVFAIDPRETKFTGGLACVGWEVSKGGFVGPTDEVPLPATVMAELPAQMATATNVIPDGGPLGGGVVLLTQGGDPFSLLRTDNGMYNWFGEDGQRWFFTPTGVLADQLEEIFDR